MRYIFAVAILMLGSMSLCFGQQPAKVAIAEVKHNSPAGAAPRECLVAFREFFQYLQKNEPGVVRDETAQKRWLTQARGNSTTSTLSEASLRRRKA